MEDRKKKHIFPMSKSYLYFNLKCLTMLAIWNPYEGLKWWLHRAYFVYFVTVVFLMKILAGFGRTVYADNKSEFLAAFSMFAVLLVDALKTFAFVVHRDKMVELVETFNWERHLPGTTQMTHFRNKVLANSLKASKIFTIMIITTVIQFVSLYYFMIFRNADYKVEKLPIGSKPLRYCFVLTNFWMAFFCDYITQVAYGLLAVCHDSFIMAVMINIRAQLRLLNFRLGNCHMTTFTIDNNMEYEYESDNIHFECVEEEMKDKQVALDPNEQLINCINFHQKIVRIVKIFKEIYSAALLPQLFISMVLLTVLLLQIILGKEGNHTEAIVAGGFLMPVILQLLAFCWGGNIILVESDKSSDSLYKSHWYTRNKQFRDNVKIFLGAIRDPLIVSAGGLCDLSAVTFKNILSKAYSGVAVLQNMNE